METMKIYAALVLASIRARMEYKTSFLFYIFAILFYYAGHLGILLIVITRFKHIHGWTLGQVSFLYGMLAFSQGFTTILFNPLNYFGEMVVKGEFDRILIRPLSPLGQLICSKFEASTVAHLIIGTAALWYGSKASGIHWTAEKWVFFPVVVLGAVMLLGGIRILVASVTFWTIKNSSLVHTVIYSSKEFIVYPVSIYNAGVQLFLTVLFPIAFVNFYPSHYFLGRNATDLFHPFLQYMTPMVGGLIFGLSLVVWNIGINHYQSTGS